MNGSRKWYHSIATNRQANAWIVIVPRPPVAAYAFPLPPISPCCYLCLPPRPVAAYAFPLHPTSPCRCLCLPSSSHIALSLPMPSLYLPYRPVAAYAFPLHPTSPCIVMALVLQYSITPLNYALQISFFSSANIIQPF